jgi:hypothetical protein
LKNCPKNNSKTPNHRAIHIYFFLFNQLKSACENAKNGNTPFQTENAQFFFADTVVYTVDLNNFQDMIQIAKTLIATYM